MQDARSDHPPPPLPAELAQRFADDLRRLADPGGAWVAPRLAPTTLLEHTERLHEAAAVREALGRFAAQPGCAGWIETPQSLQPLGGGHAMPEGTPLHAEAACGPESLQLRWADGAWLLTQQHEGHAGGVACWSQQVERLSGLPGTARWHYLVYLRAADDGTLQPFASRLIGGDAGDGSAR